jgi:hypothetical protein
MQGMEAPKKLLAAVHEVTQQVEQQEGCYKSSTIQPRSARNGNRSPVPLRAGGGTESPAPISAPTRTRFRIQNPIFPNLGRTAGNSRRRRGCQTPKSLRRANCKRTGLISKARFPYSQNVILLLISSDRLDPTLSKQRIRRPNRAAVVKYGNRRSVPRTVDRMLQGLRRLRSTGIEPF